MESIEKISVINKDKLNGEFYFQSLLEAAFRAQLLTEPALERIRLECLELLAYKVERYNDGDSSSIRIELAENIMRSNLYTLGIWLKSYPCADDAAQALREEKIFDLYKKGRKRIDGKLNAARHLHLLVMSNLTPTENYTYNATVTEAVKGFFKLYNPDYSAHEIHITADYPLCIQVENLAGIEFIQKYLGAVYYENIFCRCFSAEAIHHLLCGLDENYRDLVINLFEQVLTAALGCKLAGIRALELNISEVQRRYLQENLSRKSAAEIAEMILRAKEDLLEEISPQNSSVKNTYLQRYIDRCLPGIVSCICHAVEENTLDKVFVTPKHPELAPKLYFSFGIKMKDEEYREVVNEIMQCRYLSDRISIIKSRIRSLADLEDLFLDAELSPDESKAVLNGLETAEIVALAKRHPFQPEVEAIDLSPEEREFCRALHNYIEAQPPERQSRIREIATNLLFYT